MRGLELSRRDRRTAVSGIAIAGGLLFAARGLPALRDALEREAARTSTVETELAVSLGAEAALPVLRDSLRARSARETRVDSTLIVAATPVEGAAALASTVEDLADVAAVQITGLQIRSDSVSRSGMTRVGVRVIGIADVRGLADFLRSVEGNGAPVMVVRELSVAQEEPFAPATKPEALRVELFIDALCVIKARART